MNADLRERVRRAIFKEEYDGPFMGASLDRFMDEWPKDYQMAAEAAIRAVLEWEEEVAREYFPYPTIAELKLESWL